MQKLVNFLHMPCLGLVKVYCFLVKQYGKILFFGQEQNYLCLNL